MSADNSAAEMRRYYYGGKRAMQALETCTIVPREPRERAELFNALNLLSSLVEGYNTDSR